jgi:hypothetical protein
MAENLYQLRYLDDNLLNKSVVKINGPHDEWGYVIKKIGQKNNYETLYLIRGTGNRKLTRI